MSLVFLDPVGTLGGAERCLVDLVASLRDAAPSMRVGAILGGDGPLVAEAERHGVEVRVLPMPDRVARVGEYGAEGLAAIARRGAGLALGAGELAAYALSLRAAIASFAPTVVHTNGVKMHALSAVAVPPGVPIVWYLHDYVSSRAITARLLRAIAPRARGLVAVSRSIADDAARALGRRDVDVIYNAIDVTRFAPTGPRADLDALARLEPAPRDDGASAASPQRGRDQGIVRVGLVATYARWKGHLLFLDAAARLRAESRAPLRFYVVGGPTYATEASQHSDAELREAIAARGLSGACGLVPFQPTPDVAYRALDVVVHASTRPEPFGRTIAEAMACGRAVIVANEGGAAELIDDGVDARAFTPRDAASLARAIDDLARDPSLRARLGAAARAAAVKRFARERLGPQMLGVYRRLSQNRAGAEG